MSIDAIQSDPTWNGGNYTTPPESGLRTARYLSMIAGANPVALQDLYPTREKTEAYLASNYAGRAKDDVDANDQIYQLDSSRTYNPGPLLEKITVPVLWINSADDFINPPGLALAQQMVKRMPKARFILIPESKETKGHGSHTWAKFWKADLAKLLAK
jgi:homoserine O-acetyltransferase/O-succinyltransferase